MSPPRLQVQTLYYLGPAGTGRRKRSAAAAAQRGSQEHAAATLAQAEAAIDNAVGGRGSRKGGKKAGGGKRRKRPSDKENEAPADEVAALAGKVSLEKQQQGSLLVGEELEVCLWLLSWLCGLHLLHAKGPGWRMHKSQQPMGAQ